MIEKAHIVNFRCFQDIELDFSPLTALVGPNASGKTALLQALKPGIQIKPEDLWRHKSDFPALIELQLDNSRSAKSLCTRPDTTIHTGEHQMYQILHFDLGFMRRANQVRGETQLDQVGSNLTNVFATLPRSQQTKVAEALCRLVPGFKDVDARPYPGISDGNHILLFQDAWDSSVWYRPEEVSDGTILLLAFLVLQYQKPPMDVIGIEEPERGLHPYLLGELVTFLRRLAKSEIGPKPIQVILATHSPELLDCLHADEVRFLRVDKNGKVTVERAPVTSPDWERAFKEYRHSLGSAWLSGGLGGVPGTPS